MQSLIKGKKPSENAVQFFRHETLSLSLRADRSYALTRRIVGAPPIISQPAAASISVPSVSHLCPICVCLSSHAVDTVDENEVEASLYLVPLARCSYIHTGVSSFTSPHESGSVEFRLELVVIGKEHICFSTDVVIFGTSGKLN